MLLQTNSFCFLLLSPPRPSMFCNILGFVNVQSDGTYNHMEDGRASKPGVWISDQPKLPHLKFRKHFAW